MPCPCTETGLKEQLLIGQWVSAGMCLIRCYRDSTQISKAVSVIGWKPQQEGDRSHMHATIRRCDVISRGDRYQREVSESKWEVEIACLSIIDTENANQDVSMGFRSWSSMIRSARILTGLNSMDPDCWSFTYQLWIQNDSLIHQSHPYLMVMIQSSMYATQTPRRSVCEHTLSSGAFCLLRTYMGFITACAQPLQLHSLDISFRLLAILPTFRSDAVAFFRAKIS